MVNEPIGWIALVVALIALLISVLAFQGVSLPEAFDQAEQEAELALARADARAHLLAAQTQLGTQDGWDEAAQNVRQARADLDSAYANTEGEVRENWQQMDADLQQLEQDIENGSADAIDNLQQILERLEQDIRDEP